MRKRRIFWFVDGTCLCSCWSKEWTRNRFTFPIRSRRVKAGHLREKNKYKQTCFWISLCLPGLTHGRHVHRVSVRGHHLSLLWGWKKWLKHSWYKTSTDIQWMWLFRSSPKVEIVYGKAFGWNLSEKLQDDRWSVRAVVDSRLVKEAFTEAGRERERQKSRWGRGRWWLWNGRDGIRGGGRETGGSMLIYPKRKRKNGGSATIGLEMPEPIVILPFVGI